MLQFMGSQESDMTKQLKNNKNTTLPQFLSCPLQCVVLQISLQNLAVSPLPVYLLLLFMSNARIPSPPSSPCVRSLRYLTLSPGSEASVRAPDVQIHIEREDSWLGPP